VGGGLAAGSRLKSRLDITNGRLGQGGLDLGRQAYDGLPRQSNGTVMSGRHYDPHCSPRPREWHIY